MRFCSAVGAELGIGGWAGRRTQGPGVGAGQPASPQTGHGPPAQQMGGGPRGAGPHPGTSSPCATTGTWPPSRQNDPPSPRCCRLLQRDQAPPPPWAERRPRTQAWGCPRSLPQPCPRCVLPRPASGEAQTNKEGRAGPVSWLRGVQKHGQTWVTPHSGCADVGGGEAVPPAPTEPPGTGAGQVPDRPQSGGKVSQNVHTEIPPSDSSADLQGFQAP